MSSINRSAQFNERRLQELSSLSNEELRLEFKDKNTRERYKDYLSHYLTYDGARYMEEDYDALESPDDYAAHSVIGLIPVEVSNEMGRGKLEYEGKALLTGSILLDWWDIYARSRSLIKGRYIYLDETIKRAFKHQLMSRGILSRRRLPYSMMRVFISQSLIPVYDIDLNEEQKQILYDYAIELNSTSSSFFSDHEMIII